MSVALYLTDCMTASDFTDRLWLAVEPLQDELGLCIAELRRMLHVERILARSDEFLAELQSRVSVPVVTEPINQV
jgi:hypothetical protein